MPIYKANGKKDGLQRYRVKINYTDSFGKARQVERIAYGLEEAKELEYTLLNEHKKAPTDLNLTVRQLYDEYIKSKSYEVRETTLEKAKQVLNNHILPSFENKRLSYLNIKTLQEWKLEIESKNLSFTMRKDIFAAFRAMLNYAVKFEYLPSNPLLKIGNFKDAYKTNKKVDYYTSDEFIKFIKEAKSNAEKNKDDIYEWNYYVFFNIAFYTGLRKGEINALQWTDINDNYISVTKSLAQKLQGGDRITPPKNKTSNRTIQIPLPLKKILTEHYDRYKKAENFSEEWFICGGLRALRDTSIENRNISFSKSAGLKHIRIHDFRHSHASLLANEGINIQEIARRLGHSNIEITWNTYSHLYPREEERAVKILNKIK